MFGRDCISHSARTILINVAYPRSGAYDNTQRNYNVITAIVLLMLGIQNSYTGRYSRRSCVQEVFSIIHIDDVCVELCIVVWNSDRGFGSYSINILPQIRYTFRTRRGCPLHNLPKVSRGPGQLVCGPFRYYDGIEYRCVRGVGYQITVLGVSGNPIDSICLYCTLW